MNHVVAKGMLLRGLISGFANFPDTGTCHFGVLAEEQLLVRTFFLRPFGPSSFSKDAMGQWCGAFGVALVGRTGNVASFCPFVQMLASEASPCLLQSSQREFALMATYITEIMLAALLFFRKARWSMCFVCSAALMGSPG